jgi:uncharacterized protein (DUF2147 family)
MKSIMKTMLKALTALTLGAALAGPAMAQDLTIAGIWQMKDGYSDYLVEMCGPDSTNLCVKPVALRGKADNERNRAHLNSYIVKDAKQIGANRWKGKLELWGQTADGTLVLRDANYLTISGCFYLVVCNEFELNRIN